MAREVLDGIVIDTFGADEIQSRGQVIFLNGFPGAIGPLPAVLAATGRGFDVIAPQYPGTYDSEGEHALRNSADAVVRVIDWATARRSKYPRRDILVIAHSFGAYHLMNALRGRACPSVSKILMLAPVLSYSVDPDVGVRENLIEQVAHVKGSRKYTYRIGDMREWQQAALGEALIPLNSPWEGTAYIGFGTDDDTFDASVFVSRIPLTIRELIGCLDVTVAAVLGAGHGMHEILPHLEFLDDFFE